MTEGRPATTFGRGFEPDRLANLELRMWKAYYRRQRARLFALLVLANREQAGVSWPQAVRAAFLLARAAARFGRSTGDYDRFLPDIVRGYWALGLPEHVDAESIARRELRWWVVRREIGLAAGGAAGEAIAALYSELYGLPLAAVAEAGRLRGEAAEVRDRGADADPEGPAGRGAGYWPDVARLLRDSYRSLAAALEEQEGRAVKTSSNDYHFVTRWRLPATRDEIAEVIGDAGELARWWPSVYLGVRVVEPGDERGIGRVVDLYTKGWLPYTLRWRFRVTESDPPAGFALEAEGDFVGRGAWTFTEVAPPGAEGGPQTDVQYDWRIRAEKGVLRTMSFVMKPLFSANHHWAMAKGLESLRLELARRHADGDPALLDAIPGPPGPTFPHNLAVFRRG